MPELPIVVNKVAAYFPVSAEYLQMIEEDRKAYEEAAIRWAAMTPAEREKATAEHEARLAAEKAERTCRECGCDPDEHGGY